MQVRPRGRHPELGTGGHAATPLLAPRSTQGPRGEGQGWAMGPSALSPPSIAEAQLQVADDLNQGEAHSPQANLPPTSNTDVQGTPTHTQGMAHRHTGTCTQHTHLSTHMCTCTQVYTRSCTRVHTSTRAPTRTPSLGGDEPRATSTSCTRTFLPTLESARRPLGRTRSRRRWPWVWTPSWGLLFGEKGRSQPAGRSSPH